MDLSIRVSQSIRGACILSAATVLLGFTIAAQAQTGLAVTTTWGNGWYGHGKLVVVDVSGGMKLHTIKDSPVYGPCISRDGKQIAYIVGNGTAIRVCNIDGSGDHEIVKNIGWSGESHVYLTWCNDNWIYWGAGNAVKKVKGDGSGGIQQLCTQDHTLLGATFSADGTKGACFTSAGGWKAMAFDVCGATKWLKGGCQGTVSPNGRYVTHNNNHMKYTIHDHASGADVKVLYGVSGDNLNNHRFSRHHDDWIMYTRNAGCNGCGSGVEAYIVNWPQNKRYKLGNNLNAYDYHPGATWGAAEPPVATTLDVTPSSVILELNKSTQIQATVLDQFGNPMQNQPAVTWSVTGAGNSIADGTLTAGNVEGTFTITATAGGLEGSATLTVVAFRPVDMKLNCGGSASGDWQTDAQHASGGEPFTFNITPDISGVTNPAPAEVYTTVRHNAHTYSFDVPDADYRVRIHFIDAFSQDGRAMEYTIEGDKVLTGFSIVKETGVEKALVKEFDVTVSDGNGLQIACDPGTGNDVFEAAIEVLRTGGTGARNFGAANAHGSAGRTPLIRRTARGIEVQGAGGSGVRIYNPAGACVFDRQGTTAASLTFRPSASGLYIVRVSIGTGIVWRQIAVP